jgi:diacylglycerol kinase (ATP)
LKKGTKMSKKNKFIHVKLIANPGAGKPIDSEKNLELVIGYLKKHHIKVDVVLANPSRKATKMARRAVIDEYKIVIAMGGDGTIEAVMRGMIGSKTRLGIIPVGTENNIARSLGIPMELEKACALISSDNMLKLDMGRIKNRKGRKFNFFELATVGLSSTIFPDAKKIADGQLGSIKDAAVTLMDQDVKPKVFLTIDGESKIKVETMIVMVSNTPQFGKNFRVAPNASLQDGLLDISVYPGFSKTELVGYYAAVMNGGYSENEKVQHYQARKLKIKASPKLNIMADGVALGKGNVKIKVCRHALRVITTKLNLNQEKVTKETADNLLKPVSTNVNKPRAKKVQPVN